VHGFVICPVQPRIPKYRAQTPPQIILETWNMTTVFAVHGKLSGVFATKAEAVEAAGDFHTPLIKPFPNATEAFLFLQPFLQAAAVVYTDGACVGNGKLGARAGVGVFWAKGHPLNISRPVKGAPTNNVAELEAIEDALDQIFASPLLCRATVVVVSDSEYSIKCLRQWFSGFVAREWRTTSGAPVKNRDLLERLHAKLMALPGVHLAHVRGHVGHAGNEAADALAGAGIPAP